MAVSGSCACGRIRFLAQADPSAGTQRCNCSGCTKRGWWTLAVPGGRLTLTEGEEHLVVDESRPDLDRRRCAHCGLHLFDWIGSAAYGGPRWSVNVRALDIGTWEGLPVTWLDGLHDTWVPLGDTSHKEPDIVLASRREPDDGG